VSGPDGALEIAGRLSRAIGEGVEIFGQTLRIGASAGVAMRADGEDAETIMHEADAAMYRSKASLEPSIEIAGAADRRRPSGVVGASSI
jgi:GGDEF domain-containing protein